MAKRGKYPFECSARGLIAQAYLLQTELRGKVAIEIATEHIFHPQRKWRLDIAIPALKIGIEYQGGLFMGRRGGHATVSGMRNDWAKLNAAQLLGWMVLLFGPDETRTGEAMNTMELAIKFRCNQYSVGQSVIG